MAAPIIIFVYKRPRHTLEVLRALQRNPLASDSLLFIFCDGPKLDCSKDELIAINETRRIIRLDQWCKKVEIIESDKNMGLAASIIEGVTSVVSRYGKVIVLEDDIISSPFFLQYMNDSLDVYEHEKEVISIGAFNFFANDNQVPDTFFIPIPDCWGWATWKDRWDLFQHDGNILLKQLRERNLIKKFNLNGAYNFEQMLIDQINGKNNSWAIRWQAVAYLNNKLSLYPKFSMTKNIGFGSDGTHGGDDNYNNNSKFSKQRITVTKQKVNTNEIILKKMESGYEKSINSVNNKMAINIKKYIKFLLPPAFYILYNKIKLRKPENSNPKSMWSGNYSRWEEVEKKTDGYQSHIILDKIKNAVLKVKNNDAAYERDSVLFDKIQYSWPLSTYLLKIAIDNANELKVLDFGGSLGSSYFQNAEFFVGLNNIKWSIIEQPHFVSIGNNEISDGKLSFYTSIEEALEISNYNLLLLSSVIQYLKEPYKWIVNFINYNFEYIIVDRTGFIMHSEDRLTLQTVQENIYNATYPVWFFNEENFLLPFNEKYILITTFDNGFTPPTFLDDHKSVYWKGFIFKRK